jgi:hypothetical protein
VTLRIAVVASLALGCVAGHGGGNDLITAGANVALLPDGSPAPEPCPRDARLVMDALQLLPGATAHVEIDANQFEVEPLTLKAGPIESIVLEPMGKLGAASRLYGRVWTSGPRVVIRYYRAQQPGANLVPICAVARPGGDQFVAKPGKFPGTAELPYSSALAFVVEAFL